MTTKPIYSFNNGASLGIGQVPNNSVVIVEDSDGVGTSLQVVKKANTGITAASTITDFLADKTLYDNPAQDREYGVKTKQGLTTFYGMTDFRKDPAKVSNIGNYSIDFSSFSDATGSAATGDYSFVHGEQTYSSADNTTVFGSYNLDLDALLIVGNGDINGRKNAFEIYADGTILAPEFTVALQVNPKSLVTLEKLEAAKSSAPVPVNFNATAGQTVFIIFAKVLTGTRVFSNGAIVRDTEYTFTDNGTDTTVTFTVGRNLNDWVMIES